MPTRREKEQQVVIEGRVVADFGREFLVEFADKRQIVCTRKGRRQDATCGDFVIVRMTGSAQGSIEKVGTRRNLLYRSDQWREKTLAANVDQAVILLAPVPAFNEAFLNLSLVACEAAGIPVIIALNKADLPEHAAARKSLANYEHIGYTFLSLSAKKDVYRVVLLRSGAPEAEVLKHLELKELSLADVKDVLRLYSDAPAPITVTPSAKP